MKNRIKNQVIDIIARAIYIKDEIKYEQMIAESQAKIGPYVPQTCPVQIWA
jgi:hypothetical protein